MSGVSQRHVKITERAMSTLVLKCHNIAPKEKWWFQITNQLCNFFTWLQKHQLKSLKHAAYQVRFMWTVGAFLWFFLWAWEGDVRLGYTGETLKLGMMGRSLKAPHKGPFKARILLTSFHSNSLMLFSHYEMMVLVDSPLDEHHEAAGKFITGRPGASAK